jgi:hypothetical protein
MKLAQAKAELAKINMTIKHADGEYRVAYKVQPNTKEAREAAEASAYYTGDIWDAVLTAKEMRKWADAPK